MSSESHHVLCYSVAEQSWHLILMLLGIMLNTHMHSLFLKRGGKRVLYFSRRKREQDLKLEANSSLKDWSLHT